MSTAASPAPALDPNAGALRPRPRLSRGAFLALVVALWCLARALPVLALSDVFFFGEELEKGAVAVLLRGVFSGALDLPWTALPYHPYEGGGFCASHLKALAFSLVGENVLAHKLCAIAWGVLVLLAAFRCARRQLGEATARWLALSLVFAPEHLQRESLLHLGIHFEALVFVFLALDLGLTLARAPRPLEWPARKLFGLGLVGGFGFWFSYQLALPLALIGLALLVAALRHSDPRRALVRALTFGGAGFLIGAAPWFVMAWAVGGEVFDLHGARVGEEGGFARLGGFLAGAARAVAHDPLALAQTGALAALALYGLVALFTRRATRAFGAVLVGYLALWLSSAGASGLVPKAFGHWFALLRWAPPVVLLMVCAAHGAARARAAKDAWVARLALALVTVALVAGGAQTARIVGEGTLRDAAANFDALRAGPGAAWTQAFAKLVPRLVERLPGAGVPALISAAPALTEAASGARAEREFLSALAAGYGFATTETFDRALTDLMEHPRPSTELTGSEARAGFALGLGQRLAGTYGGAEGWVALGQLAGAMSLEQGAEYDLRCEALGRYGGGWVAFPTFLPVELDAVRGLAGAAAYRRGLGARAYHSFVEAPFGRVGGHAFVLRPAAVRAWLLETFPADEAQDILVGFDAVAALRSER